MSLFRSMRMGRRLWLLGSLVLLGCIALGVTAAAGAPIRAHAAGAQQCAEPLSATRDPSNPLALPAAPGSNPLTGANFFVDGPAHGAAAGAIASLVGMTPASLPDSLSWATFQANLNPSPDVASQVTELSKIAAQPEVQRISAYSRGGGSGAVFLQTEKILCKNLTADPGSVPILSTYFLHPAAGNCPSPGALRRAGGTFKRRVNEFVDAVDRRAAVFLLETDAVGESSCAKRHHSLGIWESYLRYEIDKVRALPHSVVYVEGGYSDANSPRYTANILNAVGIKNIRGFFTNDTHLNWTINEVRLGHEGVEDDPWRTLHRQHRQQRQRAAAQPSPEDAGQRGSLQSPGPRTGSPADDQHGLLAR